MSNFLQILLVPYFLCKRQQSPQKRRIDRLCARDNSEFTIHDAAQEDAAQGPETSAVSASSPNAAQEVTNRDEALTLAPK